MRIEHSDMVIIGGGSGGFGAAFRAARAFPKARIALIETFDKLGGTSTVGGVNNWEPGVGGLGVHYELYDRLSRKGAIGIAGDAHFYSPEEPYGLLLMVPNQSYETSLRRSATPRDQWVRVPFEPDAMAAEMEAMLHEAGNVTIYYRTRLEGVETEGRTIKSVRLYSIDRQETCTMQASVFIDCSGGVHLARLAGCETSFGEDAAERYGEPSAPAEPRTVVNGVTLCFRVEKLREEAEEKPEFSRQHYREAAVQWTLEKPRTAFITEYPNGDLCFNLLPIMEGAQFHELPYEEARAICEARALAYWHWFKSTQKGFSLYRLHSLFPMVGIRESHRLAGRYVLTEQDIRAGFNRQAHREEIIAFADHALDTHGQTNVKIPLNRELDYPYGIPYSCLLPKEYDNLITATRGSSFTHIAASSCRLSRAMMALGEAAGIAAGMAWEQGGTLPGIDVRKLQQELRIPEMQEKIIREWAIEST